MMVSRTISTDQWKGRLGIISVTRLGDLSLILGTHMFEGTNSLTQVVL